jgi:hypothetical protein
MRMPTSEALPAARSSEPRTRIELLLESIALRHQIRVLERSRTRRPCFRLWDRLFWILFSRWWPQWRDSLVIVHPQTVLRWRRDGWSALWRYRVRGRWRGGRPRISSEVRHLIVRMARGNFLWVRRGSMVNFLCWVSASPKPPCRATCRPEADGRGNRGGLFFAITAWHSVTASIPRNGRVETLAFRVSPIRPGSSDPLHRLRRYGLGSSAASGEHSSPEAIEEFL